MKEEIMTSFKEKLDKIASSESSPWIKKAQWRVANEAWLNISTKIALKILRALRAKDKSQKELASLLGVTAQQVSKIVKGEENLTLETICRIERALGISLIEVSEYQTNTPFESNDKVFGTIKYHSIKEVLSKSSNYNDIPECVNTEHYSNEFSYKEVI